MTVKPDQTMIPDEKRPQASLERPNSCHEPDTPYAEAYSAPLHRRLKSRHLQMIAIGGIIGPGLFVGSGNALHLAGPAGILISFSLVGIIVFFVMQSLGELATLIVRYPSRATLSPFPLFERLKSHGTCRASTRSYDMLCVSIRSLPEGMLTSKPCSLSQVPSQSMHRASLMILYPLLWAGLVGSLGALASPSSSADSEEIGTCGLRCLRMNIMQSR